MEKREDDKISQYIRRKLGKSKLAQVPVSALAIMFPLFVIFITASGLLPVFYGLGVVFVFSLLLSFIIYPLSRKKPNRKVYLIVDLVLIAGSITCGMYILLNYSEILDRIGMPTSTDIIMGVIAIILTLESVRRTLGMALVGICVAFLAYAGFSNYLPGLLHTSGYGLDRIVTQLYLTTQGIFGIGLSVLIKYIFLFIIMGVLFNVMGGMKLLADFVGLIVGRSTGGIAKISIVASSLFGMVSGSSVANVAFVGNFTIPLMKRSGYPSAFAGAVEACASTGGQLMPPVMGAVAFLMAEFLGVPYFQIMIAGILPAVIYYMALFLRIHLKCKQNGIGQVTDYSLFRSSNSLRQIGIKLIPFIVIIAILVYGMVIWTPTRAVLVTIGAMIVISMFSRETRLTPARFLSAFKSSTNSVLSTACACISIGIIIGVVTLTGIGLRISEILVAISGGSLLLLLIVTFIACVIFGMGVSTSVVYILVATMMAPALIKSGVPILAAHFFVMYVGSLAMITPPVALASYAAAAIADENPWKVSWQSCFLNIVAFILPFWIVFHPTLLMALDENLFSSLVAFALTIIGASAICIALAGYTNRNLFLWERILLGASGIALISNILIANITALVVIAATIIIPPIFLKGSKTKKTGSVEAAKSQ